MQKLQKEQIMPPGRHRFSPILESPIRRPEIIRIPEGRHKFSAILESPKKPEPTNMRTFLLRAHEYGQEELGRTLMSVISKSQREISSEISELIANPEQILFNPSTVITDSGGLAKMASGLILGRNALIPHYLTSEHFLKYFFRSYQEVCEAFVSEKNSGLKCEYLRVLGVLGNLLPKTEKSKLVDFVVSILGAETDLDNRSNAVQALTLLLSPKAVLPIMRAAEGARDLEFESVAYKSALILSVLGNMLPTTLPNFLFGRYSSTAKTDAAFVMLSMDNPALESTVSFFASEVESMQLLLEDIAIANIWKMPEDAQTKEAVTYLTRYAAESGLDHDIGALGAIKPYLLSASGSGGVC
ncbi:Uncharacterised protein [uncultured archaeon]|nr:Uncharacterised protein [uncultured archaeon]